MSPPRVHFPEHPKPIQEQDQGQRKSDKAGSHAERRCQSRETSPGDYKIAIDWQPYRKVSLTQLVEEFGAAKTTWDNSPECKALIAQLESLKGAARSKITNIVALGIGSLHDTRPKDSTSARRSRLQLAAVLTVGSYLCGRSRFLRRFLQTQA
jgi:SRR1